MTIHSVFRIHEDGRENSGVKHEPPPPTYPSGLESTRMDVENSGGVLTTRPPTHQARFRIHGGTLKTLVWCPRLIPPTYPYGFRDPRGWTLKTLCGARPLRPPTHQYGFRIRGWMLRRLWYGTTV
ncbi:hypothetical protein AVEN_231225-1 [Araneus ventricosus]|uniref:Uncharacterized protein n=1 Tax=Araneus ventricosus TaxID=182803 RepID=A0A4Y2TCF0_ARAVE|nr:hypothetical protein AVEN_231225-1 [Araneus ventricosus]